MAALSEMVGRKTKVERYGWVLRDEPGQLKYINKNLLVVDPTYQRRCRRTKVQKIASSWSWMACGAVLVAKRDGVYYVYDGQHRVEAAKVRADIIDLPCILFETDDPCDEAVAWRGCNTNRKLPTSLESFVARCVARDSDALYLKATCEKLRIKISDKSKAPRQMRSIATALDIMGRDRDLFDKVMDLMSELCVDVPVTKTLLLGVEYIGQRLDLEDPRLRKRMLFVGPENLTRGAIRAATYLAKGGARVYATGMMDEINKGMRNKFEIFSEGASE